MSRLYGLGNVFGSRTKKPPAARKRKDRRPQAVAAPESLERRAMLAFSPLPGSGTQLGADILISSDGLNALHELSIILDDQTTTGFVTATITTKVDGAADQVAQYFNFGGIFFSGVNDTDGSIVNRVSLWTSYNADLVGNEIAPSADAAVGLSTDWEVYNEFPAGISGVNLVNADALTVTGGVLGGTDSTIQGEFESPTLPGLIDPTNPDTYANISLFSGVGIGDAASADPIVASALTLKAQTGGISLSQDVFTRFDLNLETAQDISLSGLVEVQEGDVSLFSSSGSIAVPELIHAMAGSVTITAYAGPMRIRDIFTEGNISLSAAETITLFGLLEATSGAISVEPSSGAILLEGAQLHAIDNKIDLKAHSQILQDAPGGLIGATPILPGSLGGTAGGPFPSVTIIIAPPIGGGVAATGQALILRRPAPTKADPDAVEFSLESVVLTSRGSGYAINEAPAINITGLPGAIAAGIGPRWAEHIVAEVNVTLAAGEDVLLTTVTRSNAGDVAISSVDGGIDLLAPGQLVNAPAGSVAIKAQAGFVKVRQMVAEDEILVVSEASVVEVADLTAGRLKIQGSAGVSIADPATGGILLARTGDIDISSSAGSIEIAAALNAPEGNIQLEAHENVLQAVGSGLLAINLLNGGLVVSSDAPEINVAIAPPIGGGQAARAVVELRNIGPVNPPAAQPRFWTIDRIILVDPGNGYGLRESPEITITGMPNAAAQAIGPGQAQSLFANRDFSITAGNSVELVSAVRSKLGNVEMTAISGTLNLGTEGQLVHAESGSILLEAVAGIARLSSLTAGDQITVVAGLAIEAAGDLIGRVVSLESVWGSIATQNISAEDGLALTSLGRAVFSGDLFAGSGDIVIEVEAGDLEIQKQILATDGNIEVTVRNGVLFQRPVFPLVGGYTKPSLQAGQSVTVTVRGIDPLSNISAEVWGVQAGADYSVRTLGTLVLRSAQSSLAGNISLVSESGAIDLSRANIHAMDGAITLEAHGAVRQDVQDGIFFIDVVSGGQQVSANAPAVVVTVAGPEAGGGKAATAFATTGIIGYQVAGGGIVITPGFGTVIVPADSTPIWSIFSIEILDPGSGYATGEAPQITIAGVAGAAAVADGPAAVPFNIVAANDVEVQAGGDVVLNSVLRSNLGDIRVGSFDGDLILGGETQLVYAENGSILLETLAGGIEYQRIIAAEDVTMRSHETLTINNPLTTNGGDVSLASTGNSVELTANVLAADTLAITAKTGITQTDGLVKAANLTLDNRTATPIVMASGGNDVDRFAAKNVGAVTFADANDFRVGISLVGPMGVEVSGSTVSLSAGGTIRVAAGIDTQGLTITADSVEYVTTNSGDNVGGAFAGTLRDMIALSNQNLDRQTPQEMVFDEQLVDGNGNPLPAVDTITVGTASLPAFTRPITFDGSRVLPTAPGGRLGLLGRAGLPAGLHLGLGSQGSSITGAAVFGFTTGSGILVESANNTVDNMYVGLRSNGVTVAPNRLGVNVSGVQANSNTIGTVMYNSLTDGVVSTLRVTNRGEQAAGSTPNVIVTIAPPVGGGTAATAQAVVEEIRPGLYGLTRLVLTNPGSGYEIGENPAITFAGMPGASAVSIVAIQTKANHFTGNSDAAIVVQRGASNNLIAGNVVGVPGRAPNRTGVRIDGGSGNQVGTAAQTTDDLTPTPSNLIRGNTHYGVEIRNVRGATTVVENNIVAHNVVREGQGVHGVGVLNSMNVRIGGVSELAANQIHSQTHGAGVHLSGSTNVAIVGNHIGTDGYHLTANGHFPDAVPVWPDMGGGLGNSPFMGNGRHGIDVFGRSRDVEITANRIVDNRGSGVAIASGSSGVVLTRNEIGAWVHPVTGNIHAAGNLADGVTITAANGNTVGSGNVIGFNKGSGVHVENSVAAGLATGNRVAGAEIFGNSGHGVNVSGSSRQTIGGAGGDDGNIIKENLLDGIRLGADPRVRASAAPHGNLVSGNFVGTNDNEEIDRNWGNRNGISVIDGVSNVLSRNTVMNNRDYGIEIAGGVGNTVGGQTTNEGNFIGYNFSDGVFIHDNASTGRDVGVNGTVITAQGAGYAASRTNVIFTAPAVEGGVPARGVAIVSADGRVTGIRLTSSGRGYTMGEPVSVTIFDPLATASATATVTLGTIQAVSSISRGHVVSGNEIEANTGVGVHVMGDRTTEVQVGQNPDNLRSTGAANKISFHHVGVLVNAAMRTRVQGNVYGDNDSPLELINGANDRLHGTQTEVLDLRSMQMGIGQTLVTGELVNGGAFHQYSIDVYDTPYWDISYDFNGSPSGHQMRRFLGRALVTTNEFGRATISMTISQAMELGDYVSAKVTSTGYEPGTTVGVFHSEHRHRTPLMPTPTPSNPTPTPTPGTTTPSSGSSGATGQIPTPPRGSVPPSRL